jgi:hypothetical protein
MRVDEGRATLLAAAIAVAGTLLLLFFSGTPQKVGVAQALLSEEGAYVQLSGSATNATAGKFLICENALCITVRADDAPLSHLVYEGRWVTATGRVQVYMKNRYLVAERIEAR